MDHEQSLNWLTLLRNPSCMHELFQRLRWYHFTRVMGMIVVLYELLLDKASPDRGTIIIAGLGLAGYELVARTDRGHSKGKEDE